MKNTTLIYLEKNHQYLMMYRNRKPNDPNAGKWIGIGGKIEEGETPGECALREIREETGILAANIRFRGLVLFLNTRYETEYMFLYTSDDFTLPSGFDQENTSADAPISDGLPACDEGELHWVDIDTVTDLPLWEGDRYFLQLLKENTTPFLLTLRYDGDVLTEHTCSPL
ncbi:MAG: 8-oxo-dGTP diphosphatase [Lachnospiraceae bacterium]|nr:8-oxo-dGTP diphosphatase [Lachnospiraceae bacterium]